MILMGVCHNHPGAAKHTLVECQWALYDEFRSIRLVPTVSLNESRCYCTKPIWTKNTQHVTIRWLHRLKRRYLGRNTVEPSSRWIFVVKCDFLIWMFWAKGMAFSPIHGIRIQIVNRNQRTSLFYDIRKVIAASYRNTTTKFTASFPA